MKGQENEVKSFLLPPNKILDKMEVALRGITKADLSGSVPFGELICRLGICNVPKKGSFISWLTLGLDLSQNRKNFPLGKGGLILFSKPLKAPAIKNNPYAECTEML